MVKTAAFARGTASHPAAHASVPPGGVLALRPNQVRSAQGRIGHASAGTGSEVMDAKRVAAPLFALAILAGSWAAAAAQDLLKIAVPQRGVWDAGVPELGMRAGIFQ